MLLPNWEEPNAETSPRAEDNCVLARLSRGDIALLQPHLAPVDLPVSMQLETANSRIATVYFIERGFASVVANGSGKRGIEVGIIGREGMTGLAVLLGHDRSPYETFIQAAGAGQRISAAKLRKAMEQSVRLHQAFLYCVHAFFIQTAKQRWPTAAATWKPA